MGCAAPRAARRTSARSPGEAASARAWTIKAACAPGELLFLEASRAKSSANGPPTEARAARARCGFERVRKISSTTLRFLLTFGDCLTWDDVQSRHANTSTPEAPRVEARRNRARRNHARP